MKIEIEKVDNGYIIADLDQFSYTKFVVNSIDELFRELIDHFGEYGSRYDEERIYIVKAPGDKHPNFTQDHTKILFGDDSE